MGERQREGPGTGPGCLCGPALSETPLLPPLYSCGELWAISPPALAVHFGRPSHPFPGLVYNVCLCILDLWWVGVVLLRK